MLYFMMQQKRSKLHNTNISRLFHIFWFGFKRAVLLTRDRLAGSDMKLLFFAEIKHISSLFLPPLFKTSLQHMKLASWLSVSICYPPPTHRIKTIAEFSWKVVILKRLCLNQLYLEFMQKFPCERGPNSGVVLHTPPRDEALSGNKRYLVHSMCEFSFRKTLKSIQFVSFLRTMTTLAMFFYLPQIGTARHWEDGA